MWLKQVTNKELKSGLSMFLSVMIIFEAKFFSA